MKNNLTFPSTEKLKRKKQIELLFSAGRWLRSSHIRLVYLQSDKKCDAPCLAMFTAAKKIHRRAVKRNLLKRRMREAYRLNKDSFFDELEKTQGQLIIGFVYADQEIADFKQINIETKKLLAQVVSRLSKEYPLA